MKFNKREITGRERKKKKFGKREEQPRQKIRGKRMVRLWERVGRKKLCGEHCKQLRNSVEG